ncbi:hypothetical protein CI109_105260 [Kwoniella shandongensis]|uniref:Uncharacterized protein n=1 Tax=Kwoniella shandongensis TaxID=1734106 RepID=A0A5M6C3G8_9TREE|nr:uncharacterized protein CI109_002103 [Kwoniella shandongensis]KAA5529677.1 hypothetical protein CI109_002103 [Kwoniella shandongensis]
MTSVLQPTFDASRPQSHQGLQSSPIGSPQVHRPSSSQASLHVAPAGSYSPNFGNGPSPQPVSAYPTSQFRSFPPGGIDLTGPQNFLLSGAYPPTAPPISFYPTGPTQIYDSGRSQPMIRTVSHAHPMLSATDRTVSSRYSSSPQSATGLITDGPPTAAGQQPQIWGNPSFIFQADNSSKHINPSLFDINNGQGYTMSRSTSGASDALSDHGRLLTPNVDYHQDRLSPFEQEVRKVSDTLGPNTKRFLSNTFNPLDLQSHSLNISPHPQPGNVFYGGREYANDHFATSAERGGDVKPDLNVIDTDYERERQAQIMENRKLFEEVGLSNRPSFGARPRNASGMGNGNSRKVSTPVKKRPYLGPVRASPRIRQMSRGVSYADLDGRGDESASDEEDEYTDGDLEDEEDFRPSKRSKGRKQMFNRKKSASYGSRRTVSSSASQLSLWGLLQVYPDIPHLFPLFYYTLNNDLTINSDSVPLIGSIPSACTPLEKADTLQAFFHRGKRVLAQLDAFCARCDRKYDGPEQKWPELDYHTRIAVRDVRRKAVERCENYKYTRRDLLDKVLGKNRWQPIETDMIHWRVGMAENDPAGDLHNVTLTLPTPPPHLLYSQQRSERTIRAMPSRARIASAAAPRTVSIAMAEPDDSIYTSNIYSAHGPPPPMYGEDQVPMSVQMPSLPSATGSSGHAHFAGDNAGWENMQRGHKRSRSDEVATSPESEGYDETA